MILEIIKNVLLFSVSLILSFFGLFMFVKIWFCNKQIKKINDEMDNWHQRLDAEEINDIENMLDIDLDGKRQKKKKMIEQKIQNLRRKKEYLLEEISIYKVFKK
jgi:predicted PurR-regulated permease PerM